MRGLIYPVPDPDLPFLGVHFTRRMDGSIEAGPNAVLALRARATARPISASASWPSHDLRRLLAHGAQALESGLGEYHRSFTKRAFVHALQRLVPELQQDLVPGGAGVRAQALNRDGTLVDDFRFAVRARCTW